VSRLIIVLLGFGHKFSSLQEVQDELNSKFLDLSPQGCKNYDKIPIMTAGEDIGSKSVIDVVTEDKIEGFILQDIQSEPGVVLR